ncbi:MAG TPA: hypothetical protein VNI57_11365 [Candidatus Saccharimonadales bacterium]|nr:hypothetical protein [Candidatus Saccharimonadales bacterium]
MRKRIRHPHPVWRVIRLVAGLLLLLLALIGGLLPVVQGWMFLVPALLLLAPESRIIRKIVVRMRTRLKLRKRRRRPGPGAPGRNDVAAHHHEKNAESG